MNAALIQRAVIYFPALLLSLSVHEFAHAWVATRLGDSTPTRQGRLTLSPIAHIDVFGTILFPLIFLFTGSSFFFGWAKPVEFYPVNFTRKLTLWQGTALTAAAGPLSNLILALLSALLLRVGLTFGLDIESFGIRFLQAAFTLNVLLAVFNLFPLPPLDGSHLLPQSLSSFKEFLERYSFLLFLLLFFVPIPPLHGSLGFALIRPVVDWLSTAILGVSGLV